MADVVTSASSPAKAAPKPKKAKAAAKPKKDKAPASHPKYIEMAVAALNSLKERGGSSRQAILKYIAGNYKVGSDMKVIGTHLKLALKRGVDNGAIKNVKGTGASGSFKANPVAKKEKKPKVAKKAKSSKPKKAKSASPSKSKPKSPAKAKSPKKASKPAKSMAKQSKSPAKKTVSKKASPKKPKKAVAKKVASKK